MVLDLWLTEDQLLGMYYTFVGKSLVTWRSEKQSLVSRSSAEVKFHSMAQEVCELLWLKIILQDLKIR